MNAIIRADCGGTRTEGAFSPLQICLNFINIYIVTEKNFTEQLLHSPNYQNDFLPLPELFPLEGRLLLGRNECGTSPSHQTKVLNID